MKISQVSLIVDGVGVRTPEPSACYPLAFYLLPSSNYLSPVNSIQPVVKPVVFDNRIDNRLDVCLHDTAGCDRLYRVNVV